ncbi:EAL domain-containing protein [Lacticaseibacillus baoqingensis]|uniref:EAL domain-containing protein n=1 Tax=Lacticaseibacillus baoqingensis TaxID=2486013 RepID=A0ABW4E5N0_9LACO|nr:EAL domain-containing protein [Lacticaseibacillus baoqingensis]
MITFYGQPKFAAETLDKAPVGYELLIRQHVAGQWLLPEDFTKLPPAEFEDHLRDALSAIPDSAVQISFNLERMHFVDPAFFNAIIKVQATTAVTLTVELTERHDPAIDNTAIVTAAKRYYDAGIAVCIDDVGSGNNLPGLVEALTPYVTTYKFGLQNLRTFNSATDLKDRFDFWAERALHNHKYFDIAGIESLTDIEQLVSAHPSHLVQGFYLGEPVPLSTTPF